MPRNISFRHTADQIRDRTKTVTRRLRWHHAKPGEILNACVQLQGLKKGDKVEKICQIRIVSVRRERLDDLLISKDNIAPTVGRREVDKEGFPNLPIEDFVRMFCRINLCCRAQFVTRIEFEYIS
jgi:hypothetical protein